MAVLDDIVAVKKREVADLDLSNLRAQLKEEGKKETFHQPVSLCKKLDAAFGVIAELKRKSPSAGQMKTDLKIEAVAEGYTEAGAAAISVLTDHDFFGGSLEDLKKVRRAVDSPLLRKDFVIDRTQLYEARLAGADLVLLIVRILEKSLLKALNEEAQELGMEVLVETHDQRDLDIAHEALGTLPLLGYNNRNLDTLKIDVNNCLAVYGDLPPHRHAIAESGIKTFEEIQSIKNTGYRAVLVGQTFMQSKDPAEKLAELLECLK
jgi:indole-3-glycerol phosphate synthase